MHQPYYKDDILERYLMPWVFLHAIKDYYEIPWLCDKYGFKSTINIVPSLMVQLDDYAQDLSCDDLLKTILKPVASLSDDEKSLIKKQCFYANKENMIAPLSRYYELFEAKDETFSDDDYLDLEVLFILSWCGNYLRQTNDVVARLIKKMRGFSHEDKLDLMENLRAFVSEIMSKYKELEQKGTIDIFTTPFYHPITPILLNHNAPKEANSQTPVAEMEDMPSYAEEHTKQAVKIYKEKFGKSPIGFWPSEGAVSEETLKLFSQNGIEIACTDEEILFGSKTNLRRQDLYRPYSFHIEGKTIKVFFRDKPLSDLIGFTYASVNHVRAVDEFIENLRKIYDACDFDPSVCVFLDGENAWEYYPNNAYDFFCELYSRLNDCDWVNSMRLSEAKDMPTDLELQKIKPGSWIGGSLNTWMGHREKNLAWELLSLTCSDFESFKDELDEKSRLQAKKEIMIAQGSDWFWWYGDDHYTLLASEFDALFRRHLQNVYFLAKKEIPKEILVPIKKEGKSALSKNRKPSGFISPTIDGKDRGFFEWTGSGRIDLSSGYSVMDSSAVYIETVEYGIDAKNLYFRITPESSLEGKSLQLSFVGKNKDIVVDLGSKPQHYEGDGYVFANDVYLEFGINKEHFGITRNAQMHFYIKENDAIIQRAPLFNEISLDFESGYDAVWYI